MQITQLPDQALAAAAGREGAPAKGTRPEPDPAAVRKVAREFEAMFVGMMLKSMRETVGTDKLTGGGRAEETFRALLDQEYAQRAVEGEGIGLARSIERELIRSYGVPAPAQGGRHED